LREWVSRIKKLPAWAKQLNCKAPVDPFKVERGTPGGMRACRMEPLTLRQRDCEHGRETAVIRWMYEAVCFTAHCLDQQRGPSLPQITQMEQ
jgi:hypothetical protein